MHVGAFFYKSSQTWKNDFFRTKLKWSIYTLEWRNYNIIASQIWHIYTILHEAYTCINLFVLTVNGWWVSLKNLVHNYYTPIRSIYKQYKQNNGIGFFFSLQQHEARQARACSVCECVFHTHTHIKRYTKYNIIREKYGEKRKSPKKLLASYLADLVFNLIQLPSNICYMGPFILVGLHAFECDVYACIYLSAICFKRATAPRFLQPHPPICL